MLQMFENIWKPLVKDLSAQIPEFVPSKYSTIDRYRLNLNKIKCNNSKVNWNTTIEFEWVRIIEYVFVSEKNLFAEFYSMA